MTTIKTESSMTMTQAALSHMRTAGLLMFLGASTNCAPASPVNTPAASGNSTQAVPSRAALSPAAVVRREVTPSDQGNGTARVVIHNSYLITQYVFLDFVANPRKAEVKILPQSEQSVEVTPGAHSIAVSDSAGGDRNPQYIAEVFDAGFEYRYEVVAR